MQWQDAFAVGMQGSLVDSHKRRAVPAGLAELAAVLWPG